MGGTVGVGTVFIAFFLGPIVGFSIPQCKTLLIYILIKKESQNLATLKS
jgi:uncharacterized membrane protein YczE